MSGRVGWGTPTQEEMTLHRHAHQQLLAEVEELVDSVMEEEAIVVNPDSDATLQFSALAAKASSRRYDDRITSGFVGYCTVNSKRRSFI